MRISFAILCDVLLAFTHTVSHGMLTPPSSLADMAGFQGVGRPTAAEGHSNDTTKGIPITGEQQLLSSLPVYSQGHLTQPISSITLL